RRKDLVPADKQQYAYRHSIKNNRKDQHPDLSQRFPDPVEIRPQRKKQEPISFPNDKGDQDGIKKTQLYLQVGKIMTIDHTCHQWNGNSKEGNKYQPETNIIDLEIRSL